jgi:hypothetical protein
MSDLRDLAILCKEIDCLTEQVDALRKERDEARRDLCERMTEDFNSENQGGMVSFTTKPEWVAKDHGWDCYKNGER